MDEELVDDTISIDDEDASCELELLAFAELLEHQNRCDAAVCKCPKGRDHISEKPSDDEIDLPRPWRFIHCQNCGSKSVHTRCIPGPRSAVHNHSSWGCQQCQSVLRSCSLQRREIIDQGDDDVVSIDEDGFMNSETSAPSQENLEEISCAKKRSASLIEVVDLVEDDEDDDMELSSEDDDMELSDEDENTTLHDEKQHVVVELDDEFQPPRLDDSLANVPKEGTQLSMTKPRPSRSPPSHEKGSVVPVITLD